MEANYFTILWWFLPYIDMNHPWVYLCPTILNKVFFFKYLFTWLHQVLVASGLSCPVACGIFPDQRLNHVLCTGRRFLTTGSPRKSPSLISVLGPSEGLLRIPNCLFSSLSSSLDHKFLYWFSHSQNLAECNRVVKKKKRQASNMTLNIQTAQRVLKQTISRCFRRQKRKQPCLHPGSQEASGKTAWWCCLSSDQWTKGKSHEKPETLLKTLPTLWVSTEMKTMSFSTSLKGIKNHRA